MQKLFKACVNLISLESRWNQNETEGWSLLDEISISPESLVKTHNQKTRFIADLGLSPVQIWTTFEQPDISLSYYNMYFSQSVAEGLLTSNVDTFNYKLSEYMVSGESIIVWWKLLLHSTNLLYSAFGVAFSISSFRCYAKIT